jgi:hypothetical protein
MIRQVVVIARHLLGLFVDDGGFALLILVWLAAVAMLAVLDGVAPIWRGPLLFAGLALLLARACRRA